MTKRALMKKQIFILLGLVPFLSAAAVGSSFQDQLNGIDQKIEVLTKELEEIRVKELSEEVKGQGLMMADWSAYAKEVELIRKLEIKEDEIQLQIDRLQEVKANLIKQRND